MDEGTANNLPRRIGWPHPLKIQERSVGPRIWLTESGTERELPGNRSLAAEGIDDGDILTLRIEHPAEASYMLGPGPDPEFWFDAIRSDRGEPPQGGEYLWGAVLYTDEDAGIAAYIRRYFLELNILSGGTLRLLVVEKPSDWREAKKYWREHLDPETFQMFAQLRWLFYKPYDRRRVYEIAAALNVRADQLPCIALLAPSSNEPPLVFPIPASPTPDYFRKLFSQLATVMGDHPTKPMDVRRGAHYGYGRALPEGSGRGRHAAHGPTGTVLPADAASKNLQWNEISRRHQAIVSALKPQEGGGASNTYTFFGNTVFLNRPSFGPGEGPLKVDDDG